MGALVESDLNQKEEMERQTRNIEEREYPHWNRVYIAVIVYTIGLIVGLWALGKMFE